MRRFGARRTGAQSQVQGRCSLTDPIFRADPSGTSAGDRIDGEPAIASSLVDTFVELGFHPGPRRVTLT